MPEWKGFAASIICLPRAAISWTDDNAVPAEEFGFKKLGTKENPRLSCWIECQTGQEFAVHWECPEYDISFLVELYMDGKFVDRELLYHKNTKGKPPGWRVAFEGFRQEDEAVRPFAFSEVQFGPHVPSNDDNNHIGLISLRFYHIELYLDSKHGIENDKSATFTPRSRPETGSLGDEKRGFVTHRVSANTRRKPIKRPKSPKKDNLWMFKYPGLPWNAEEEARSDPFVVFEFKYRSRAFLQAKGLIKSIENTSSFSTSNQRSTENQSPTRNPRKRKAGPGAQDNITTQSRDDDDETTGIGRLSISRDEDRTLDPREGSPTIETSRLGRIDNTRESTPQPARATRRRLEDWQRDLDELENDDEFYGPPIPPPEVSMDLDVRNELDNPIRDLISPTLAGNNNRASDESTPRETETPTRRTALLNRIHQLLAMNHTPTLPAENQRSSPRRDMTSLFASVEPPMFSKKRKVEMLSLADSSGRSFQTRHRPQDPPEIIEIKDEEEDAVITKPEEGDSRLRNLRQQIHLLEEDRDIVKEMLKLKAKPGSQIRERIRLLQEDRKTLGELIELSAELGDDDLQFKFLAEKRKTIQDERQLLTRR